jgi:hypothetical protein
MVKAFESGIEAPVFAPGCKVVSARYHDAHFSKEGAIPPSSAANIAKWRQKLLTIPAETKIIGGLAQRMTSIDVTFF